MSKYLEFKEDEESGELIVSSKKQKMYLGKILYYIPWKQYVFIPASNSAFNDECLEDITKAITDKNKEEWGL